MKCNMTVLCTTTGKVVHRAVWKSAERSFNTQTMQVNQHSRSLQWVPVYDVMEQSQVKFSHCWMHTPMLAQESSWQVVLGPGGRREAEREVPQEKSNSQATSRATSGPEQCRTHAEEVHSRYSMWAWEKERGANSATTGSPAHHCLWGGGSCVTVGEDPLDQQHLLLFICWF